MGIFSWVFNKATGGVIESVGTAVNKNIRTLKGDRAEAEQHINDEQLAVLASHAAEFASRKELNAWDSFVDGLNRLPRPLMVFWVFGLMVWPAIDLDSFTNYMISLSFVPDEIWTLFLAITAFFFGSRIISQDIRKPRLSPEQREKALETIKEREQAIIEARTPLIVEQPPTRKPPQPTAYPTPEPTTKPSKLPDLPSDTTTTVAVEQMIQSLIEREGGYVDHVADKGGPTKYGITLATLADWRGEKVTADDVKSLTRAEAEDIYLARYYLGPNIDGLPVGIQAHVMDIGVNSGPRTAIRLLQRTLNGMGERLAVDGIIGPETRDACRRHDASKINNALVEMRLRFYDDIVAANSTQQVFLTGWQRRARLFSSAPGIAA